MGWRSTQGTVLALLLAACGGQTTSSAQGTPDAGPGAVTDARTDGAAEPTGGDGDGSPGFLAVLQGQGCLPQALPVNANGDVGCTIFEVLPSGSCSASSGLAGVDSATSTKVLNASNASPSDVVCSLDQIPVVDPGGTCADAGTPGWCYVTGAGAGSCPQTIVFTAGAVQAGAVVLLGCS